MNRLKRVLILTITLMLLAPAVSFAAPKELVLPAALTTIENQAFYGDKSLSEVRLPWGVSSIEDRAFANSSVKRIYLPASVKMISGSAFRGCTGVVGYGSAGTYGQNFMLRAGFRFDEMDTSGEMALADRVYHSDSPGELGFALDESLITVPVLLKSFENSRFSMRFSEPGDYVFSVFTPSIQAETFTLHILRRADETSAEYAETEKMVFTRSTDVQTWLCPGITAGETVVWYTDDGAAQSTVFTEEYALRISRLGPVVTFADPVLTAPTPEPAVSTPPSSPVTISKSMDMNRGRVTVSWADSGGSESWIVYYRPCDPGRETANADRIFETVTDSPACTFTDLIPGHSYEISVSGSGSSASEIIRVPSAPPFFDGQPANASVHVTMTPCRLEYGGSDNAAAELHRLSASEMTGNIGNKSYEYGIRYSAGFPVQNRGLSFLEQVCIIAPNGFIWTDYSIDRVFPENGYEMIGNNLLGRFFFDALYAQYQRIPDGEYTVELYWDGMLVNTGSFEIMP